MSKLQSFEHVSVKGEMPYKVTYKRFRKAGNRLLNELALRMKAYEGEYENYRMPEFLDRINTMIADLSKQYPRCSMPEVTHWAGKSKDGFYFGFDNFDCPSPDLYNAYINIDSASTGETIMGLYLTKEP